MINSHHVMYHGTVRSLSFQEQLRATLLAGCKELTTGPREYLQLLSHGTSTNDMKKMAADAGVLFGHLDPLCRWLPRWEPDNSAGPIPPGLLDFEEDDVFRFAEALESRSLTVVGCFPVGSVSLNEQIDCFGKLCDRAKRHDIRCDLEFVAFWGLADLATAWDIVRTVNAPNSGIMFDFWHYSRGRPDDDLLRSIPGRWITGVQLDDGNRNLEPGVSNLEDTAMRRVPPGRGEFRVREIVSILRDIGGLNRVGPEIFSSVFDKLPADDIAAACRDSIDWALANQGDAQN